MRRLFLLHTFLLLSYHTTGALNLKHTMGQTISSTQFFLYGKKHFTQNGYLKHIKKYAEPVQVTSNIGINEEAADGVNLTGKVVVVTGANSGLGKEVATYSAAKGAKLYMLCRSKDRAEAARDEIMEKTGNKDIEIVLVDVAELSKVRDAANTLKSKEPKIHAIVCNAGVLLNDRRESSEGNELTLASHLIGGSYLLSKLLMDQVKAADGQGRIIMVTSGGMYNYKFPAWNVAANTGDQKEKYNGVNLYAYAKRGQVLLAERWSKEYPDVTFCTVHPGWADTPAVEEAFGDSKKYLKPLREPWQGAEGVTWLVGTDRSNLESGDLYLDRKSQPKHLAGPFFSEGSFTKNSPEEVDEMMENLKKVAGI
jgi:dehydrogenase/reductase SDR family protein 12